MIKHVYFKQFSLACHLSSHSLNVKHFYLSQRLNLSGAATPSQSGPGSDGNEWVLRIPLNFSITKALPSDCLVSYPEHLLGVGAYPN